MTTHDPDDDAHASSNDTSAAANTEHESATDPHTEHALLQALTSALNAFQAEPDDGAALRESFEAFVQGLKAERSFLARVDPLTRRITQVLTSKRLSAAQIEALREGRSSPGISATLVRAALHSGRTHVIEDGRLALRTGEVTGSLARGDYSVACAAVCDPYTRAPLAVLYIQTSSLTATLSRALAPHLGAYTTALGHAWHAWEREQRVLTAPTSKSRAREPVVEIVGHSDAIRTLRGRVQRFLIPVMQAQWPDPITILGETGTGKDVLARYLHAHSPRARGPFVAVNCASIRGDRIESELFGHVRGAFTGADRASEGLFVAADKGVLFLDELGDMPLEGQVLLLRALETRRVRPLGSGDEREVDVQVICATNRNLADDVRARRFRQDLYYRIKYFTVHLRPLRERPDDVRPLLAHYLHDQGLRFGKRAAGMSRRVLRLLVHYSWPGNVRELKTVCMRLMAYVKPGALIDERALMVAAPEVFDEARRRGDKPTSVAVDAVAASGTLAQARAAFQREYVGQVGHEVRWNKTVMARRLGLTRGALYRLLRRYDLKEGQADEQ